MSQSRTRCSAERDVRLVTSNVHPGRPCQPCVLCNRGNLSKYFHPKSWKDVSLLETLQQHEPSLHIQADSCICRPCQNEVKDIKRDQFIPRWRKSRMTQICIVPECTHSAQKATKLTSKSAILSFFTTENTEDSDMSQSSDSTNEGVPLCAEHYGAWYRSSHPSHIQCKTCGKTLIDISKSRPYPQPLLIYEKIQIFLVKLAQMTEHATHVISHTLSP